MLELILGGQKSGKSRRAEDRARAWLAQSSDHRAVIVATALALDDEMRERIARHQSDRAQRLPGAVAVEKPVHLAQAVAVHSNPQTMVVVDCLTLWLTNLLMPVNPPAIEKASQSPEGLFLPQNSADTTVEYAQAATLLVAIANATGPVVLVSNEIGLGVIPLGRDVRAFVDTLGRLNQDVARVCDHVTLMTAGLPLALKGSQ